MAGNVTTPEMVQELILAGADIVKIFIGTGSQCKTRSVTGVGYGSFSATVECANVAHGLRGHICTDGGFSNSGNISKAFCAGADFVMLGGMLAGTDECDGEWVEIPNYLKRNSCPTCKDSTYPQFHSCGCYLTYQKDKYLQFFGMSSYEAMSQFGGKDKQYRASEGKCELIPYKGPVSDVIKEILGGIRSTGSYIGAANLKDYPRCSVFCRLK